MPSDGPPPFRRGGGGLRWRRSCYPQRLSLRGQSPRRCGRRLPRSVPSDGGQPGFPALAAERRSEAAPRVPPSLGATARRTRGVLVVRAPPPFERWCATGADKGGGQDGSPLPPCGEVALTPVIPRGKAIEHCRGQGGSTDRSKHPRRGRFTRHRGLGHGRGRRNRRG